MMTYPAIIAGIVEEMLTDEFQVDAKTVAQNSATIFFIYYIHFGGGIPWQKMKTYRIEARSDDKYKVESGGAYLLCRSAVACRWNRHRSQPGGISVCFTGRLHCDYGQNYCNPEETQFVWHGH